MDNLINSSLRPQQVYPENKSKEMVEMSVIKKYFPEISDEHLQKLNDFRSHLTDWNDKINLISRKDIDNIEINHILHSLSIAKFIKFKPGTSVLDLGSGGGLPGIPLAIMFPESNFTLIDRIGKKMKAADNITEKLGLKNVKALQGDVAELKDKFDFVVSRGVMPQPDIYKATKKKISTINFNAVPNGLISLKGGDLCEELKTLVNKTEIVDISNYFEEPFFETKKIVYTSL